MENVKSFFDSFKEFIWDIIGYLIPGSYIIILSSVFVNKDYFIAPESGSISKDFYPYIFIVISYLLGHVAYGFGWLKEVILGKKSFTKRIEENVSKRKAFILSKELISKSLLEKGIIDDLSTATVRDIRSIAMSYSQEQDQKIYTFTFRSDLSNQTGNISIVFGLLGIIFSIFKCLPIHLFKIGTKYVIVYVILIICYFLLRETRNRFYSISIGLPFSILTANATKK